MPYLYSGIGHECQFLESQILVEILRILFSMSVPALPIHDAVLVPASKAEFAKRVMLYTFQRKTGYEGVVEIITRQMLEQEQEVDLVLAA